MRYKFVESKPGYSCMQCAKAVPGKCRNAKCGGADEQHRRKDGKNGHFVACSPKPKPKAVDKVGVRELLNKLLPEPMKYAGWAYPTRTLWLTQPEVDMINQLKGKK